MHRRSLVVLVLLALAAVPAFATHSWGGYHWARTANPFTLKVHDNVTSNWEPYLAGAQADWNASVVLDLNVLWQSPLSNVKRCTSAAGVIEVCNAKYGQNGWLGIAGISITGGTHITKAYTKLNDTYFVTPTYDTPAWRRMVTCQEIAHDFGLDHQDEAFGPPNLGSCMDYTNDPDGGGAYGPSNEHPNAHDFAQIELIYAHLDSTTTVANVWDVVTMDATRPRTIEEHLAETNQFGIPVRFDPQGRPSLFLMPAPDHAGEDHWTHVFWAPVEPDFSDDGVNHGRAN